MLIALMLCGLLYSSEACAPTSPGTVPKPMTTTTTKTTTVPQPPTTTTTVTPEETTMPTEEGCKACGDPLPITIGEAGGGTIANGTWTFGMNEGCKTAMLTCSDPLSANSVTLDVFWEDEYFNLDQECRSVTLSYPVTCQADGTWQTVIKGTTMPNPQFGCAVSNPGTAC